MEELKKLKQSIEEYIQVNRLEYAKSKYGLGKLAGLRVVLDYIDGEIKKNQQVKNSWDKKLNSF